MCGHGIGVPPFARVLPFAMLHCTLSETGIAHNDPSAVCQGQEGQEKAASKEGQAEGRADF
jgi:hypothetical protein